MGLFNFFSPKKKEPISSINDLFKINLKAIPDKRFTSFGLVKSNVGLDFYSFDLALNYLECGIFNEINVWQYTDGNKFIILKSNNLLRVKLEKVKELVDSLFSLYGPDDIDNGEFTDQERNEFYGHHGSYLRSWYDPELPFSSIDINVDREANEISIEINVSKAKLDIQNSFSNNENRKKSIYELFNINLKEIPDKRFNSNGFISSEKVPGFYSFDLSLDYLECGIFNEIEIHQSLDGSRNIFFISKNLLNVELEKVKELVDSLGYLYGIDLNDKGRFTEQDKNEFYSNNESSLRTWVNLKLPFEMIDIVVNRENNEITLTIMIREEKHD